MYQKLSDEIKSEIVGLRKAGMRLKEISKKFSISISTISDICRKKWRDGTIKRKRGSCRNKMFQQDHLENL